MQTAQPAADAMLSALMTVGRLMRQRQAEDQLDPGIFWRVHRSHLVNINKVKEIVPWFNRNYLLRMKDEKMTEIPVSRNHTRRLREYLKL